LNRCRASSASSITSAIKGENINLRTSSVNINLNIESDYIECKTSSSSITEGMALNMEATASSGSD
jgi:hypothetical protein